MSFFCMWIFSFLTICWENWPFLLNDLGTSVKKSFVKNLVCEGLFPGFLFYSIVCLQASTILFWLLQFVVSCKSRKSETSNFDIFQDCLAIPLGFKNLVFKPHLSSFICVVFSSFIANSVCSSIKWGNNSISLLGQWGLNEIPYLKLLVKHQDTSSMLSK